MKTGIPVKARTGSAVQMTVGYKTRTNSHAPVTTKAGASIPVGSATGPADQLRKNNRTYVTTGKGATNNAA